MASGFNTIVFPVKDLDKAKAIYGALLGVEPGQDSPYYVGYQVNGQDIGLDPNGHANGMTGPIAYVRVDDIVATIESLVEAGADVRQDPTDVGGGRQIAKLVDADGNPFGLIQDS